MGVLFFVLGQRHRGETKALMDNRKRVYQSAKHHHPERWSKRATRNWDLEDEVWLNPDRSVAGQLSQAV